MRVEDRESELMEAVLHFVRDEVGDFDWRYGGFLRIVLSRAGVEEEDVETIVGDVSRLSPGSALVIRAESTEPELMRYVELVTRRPRVEQEVVSLLKKVDVTRWPAEDRLSAATWLFHAGAWAESLRASEPLVGDGECLPTFLLVRVEPHIRLGRPHQALLELVNRISLGNWIPAGTALAAETARFLAEVTGDDSATAQLEEVQESLLRSWEDWAPEADAVLAIAVLRGAFEEADRMWSLSGGVLSEYYRERLSSVRGQLASSANAASWARQLAWLDRIVSAEARAHAADGP